MAQKSILQLARQGDPKAIAALVNHYLASKSITTKTKLKGGCLHLLLESAQVPNQKVLVAFIRKVMMGLSAEPIKTVKVYGRNFGVNSPVWSQIIELRSNAASTTLPIPSEQITPLPPLQDCIAQQNKNTFPSPSITAKKLAEELLELVNYDQAKAEVILSEIVFQNSSKSLEWCFEMAIDKLLQNQRLTWSKSNENVTKC
ncbi:MAG: hypothetical protein F6K36_04410 [Symploca sp. SIO3C6]|nr:hypothetical protein [Symploca sp. SIO3C6]